MGIIDNIGWDEILAYRPEDKQTHTSSRVLNAVLRVLYSSKVRSVGLVAKLLRVDGHKLSCAVEMETGMTLRTLINKLRARQVHRYMEEHPEERQADVASRFGFSSRHALWHFFLRVTLCTPGGRRSRAPRVDRYTQRQRGVSPYGWRMCDVT